MSDEKLSIHDALSAVMEEVRAVGKNERNDSPGGHYNFRGIDAITNAVGPVLRKHNVIVAPTRILEWHYGTVTVGKNQTQMGHSRLLIEFTWYGPGGDSLPTVAAGEAFDSGDKATAKAHSVAFRTVMIQTLCLPTDERDPDADTYERVAPRQQPKPRNNVRPKDPVRQAKDDLAALIARIDVHADEAVAKFEQLGHGDLKTSTDVKAINDLREHYLKLAGRA